MDWTEIVVGVVAAAGGFFGAVISNNKRLSVFEAVVSTKLDSIIETQKQQSARIDAHNHLNERITRLEVLAEEAKKK